MGNYQVHVTPENSIDNINGPIININPSSQLSTNIISKKKFALGIIDPQNDFFKSGPLAINQAEEILGPINKLRYLLPNVLTFFSQDFHPPNHMSFASTHGVEAFSKKQLDLKMENGDVLMITQDMWPAHCVASTSGANFHKDIVILPNDKIFRKGTKTMVESYSAFGDENESTYENTGLDQWLKSNDITDIVLVGVATDYCVYNTALDSLRLGYSTHLILSCTRGVKEDGTQKALQDLQKKNVKFYSEVDDFIKINFPLQSI